MSFSDYELIYSRRYPKEDYESLINRDPSEEDRREAETFVEMIEQRLESMEPDPEREKLAEKFVADVIKFGELFGMDMDIKRKWNRIEVDIYSLCYYFDGVTAEMLADLISRCGEISLITNKRGEINITLAFSITKD